MTYYNQTLRKNPLQTRADYEQALVALLQPVYEIMKAEQTPGRVHLGDSGSVYEQGRRDIEGFMRTLWGVGPLCSTPARAVQYRDYFEPACAGILAGVDPQSDFYWGELHPYDQLFVEMGSLATMLTLTKDFFWAKLDRSDQQHLYHWLDQINQQKIPATNWLFFRILVNNFFTEVGLPVDAQAISHDLATIDQFYLTDGWYFDGYPQQIDYYIPFGMQYYGLLTATLGRQRPAAERARLRARASQFAATFKNWFVNSGAALPFGRSLTYRFAQSAFWAAAAFGQVDLDGVSLGETKYLLRHNMRDWFQQPIFSSGGLLTIGYRYPNLVMAEGYNAPGSPYWALKNFIVLALPDDDPFWQAPEEQPHFASRELNPSARMLLIHDAAGDELQAFTAGQHSHEHAHAEEKYEKYVYSTTFGFSVKKDTALIKQGAFDSTLALTDNGSHYQMAYGYRDYQVHEDYVYSLWQPWPDVRVQSFIIPCYPWHFRIHLVTSGRALDFVEGSFSAPAGGQEIPVGAERTASFYDSAVGMVGVVSLTAGAQASLTTPEPNTNLCYSQTMLPLLQGKLSAAPQPQLLVSAYLGAAGSHQPQLTTQLVQGQLVGHTFVGQIGNLQVKVSLNELK